MARKTRLHKYKKTDKVGKPPGTLLYMGPKKNVPITVDVFDYNLETIQEFQTDTIPAGLDFKNTPTVTWIDVKGLHNLELIEQIGQKADIHPLTLEDLLNVDQRPKIDIFDTYVYIVIKILSYNDQTQSIDSDQISIILGQHYVLTFLEEETDTFEPLRTRLKAGKGKLRSSTSDYLAYAILDVIVDNYYDVIEKVGERIEDFEEKLMTNPHKMLVKEIYSIKREMLELRKSVWPLREIITKLEKGESDLIRKKTLIYLRDLYDHTIQIIETAEIYRDMISGLLDLYLSSVSNRMNEIIKVLTILSSIFIPLTFIVGVYGMNFRNMPELEWEYGYYVCLLFMLIIAIGMILYFRLRKWL